MTRTLAAVLVLAAAVTTPAGAAAAGDADTFSIVIGVNDGIDDLPRLRYADDDAVQYAALFRAMGGRALLLADLDDNTRRVHPQAVSLARRPTRTELDRAVREVAAEVRAARRRGRRTELYLVYAGHGELRNGRGVLGLDGAELSGEQLLRDVVGRAGADTAHVIVDACYAALVVDARGPGGRRRPLRGFSRDALPAAPPGVGLLLSSTTGRESHEWEGFQAGVFSHEVRSGLYGAADADRDGRVSYREIAAFVARANAAIPNERFRPQVLARAPAGVTALVDLRGAARRIEIAAEVQGHYVVENEVGVRLAELHGDGGAGVAIVRPESASPLFLVRGDGVELAVPDADVVRVHELEPRTPRVIARGGAAHAAFELVFSLPFGRAVVEAYEPEHDAFPPPAAVESAPAPAPHGPRPRQIWMWTSYGVGVAVLAAAGGVTLAAMGAHDGADRDDSHAEVADRNERIERLNLTAGILYGAAAAALATGVVLTLWPDGPSTTIDVVPGSALVGVSASF